MSRILRAVVIGALVVLPAHTVPEAAFAGGLQAQINPDRYMRAIQDLSSQAMGGRQVGTPGSRKAISYIASKFSQIGLRPGYRGSYVQNYVHSYDGRANAANVIGVIPGSDPALKHQYVLVTAHLDGLGRGLSDGCPNDQNGNCIKPGANDNASGTAALFEIAHALRAVRSQLRRTVVFIAFDGEECGCTGSNHYVFDAPAYPLKDTVFVMNIDEIGHGGDLDIPRSSRGGRGNCENDAVVFARVGIQARSLDGYNPSHHQCSDTPDRMNVARAVATINRALGYVWDAAQ